MAEFNWSGLLGSITTVVAFIAFLAIVAWAYSSRRKDAFEAAANEPFALPDDDAAPTFDRAVTGAAGPSPGARCSPSGGSAAAPAASVGAHIK
jgi:cytochrome c oxidase cbb3-type subunit 4